ncbi:aldehyde dehydrogenase (NADP(+)) [Nocardioides lianchengensis]|uniref:NADP-dependent aldehyde dehydrogenase n=1 Tax=Nocardioides lianchengensis TaxID=1045774 RepID=A0A1G6TM76_9ACTN|nr:aldehyde dehydrogenase (NADP(+)) [Nocardioides lianchengensis]NYG11709.1 NADP-dependent aldehyde dehydrogenase [Nocardioides lianchengensis]SDD30150.1 NADP-dependent aldehyde dehydrogenase [Nocardioides lianchengensis]
MTDPRSIIAGTESDRPDVVAATTAATEAFAAYRATGPEERAAFLEAVAAEIEADGEAIIEAAVAESHLPLARITGELGRTTGQLRLFAGVVRRGDHLGVRLDPALPDRTPLPRPDLRQRQIPLGPVAVFGASNFPLAFSTAGGDTASALAAGCPVVVKGHPAHPRAGHLVATAVSRAVARAGLPAGTFSFLLGPGFELGQELVADPRIKAVGFTGSRGGGLALVAAAAARPEPIPVYAEMSSINPVVVLPGALESSPDSVAALATAYVGSLTLGAGQFCTNPGLLFLPTGAAGDAFLAAAGEAVAAATGATMLTSGIAEAYRSGTAAIDGAAGVRVVARGDAGGDDAPAPQLVEATSLDGPVGEEVFGAAGVVVRYDDLAGLLPRLEQLEGQLTATVHATDTDADAARALLAVLELKVGRILFNGWPTGVEVGHAMVHGGPFPSTSDSRTTSVGSLAIERFQRPVAYQDVPDGVLPDAVRDANPWGLRRRIDGELE